MAPSTYSAGGLPNVMGGKKVGAAEVALAACQMVALHPSSLLLR